MPRIPPNTSSIWARAVLAASVLVTGLLAAGGWAWMSNERLRRAEVLSDEVNRVEGELNAALSDLGSRLRTVTASFGVAEWHPGMTVDEILRAADLRLLFTATTPVQEYGTPTMSMPRWSSGAIMVKQVVSCPPCVEAVEVKTPAGLPSMAPLSQREAVESMRRFIW